MSLLRIWLALVVLSLVLIVLHSNSLSTDVVLEESDIKNLVSPEMEINVKNYDPLNPSSNKAVDVAIP